MFLGQQATAELDPGQIAASKNRLQLRMEQDPSIPSMQPGGLTGFQGQELLGSTLPVSAPVSQQPPATPFQWGAGGQRLTADEIASRRAIDQQQIATGMDFSPVRSWTQGMARVAQALVGSLDQKRLDKATAANAAESQAAIGALSGGTAGSAGAPSVAALLANPYISDSAREVAKLQYQASLKRPPEPSEFERSVAAAGIAPGTPEYLTMMRNYADSKADPTQLVSNGDGSFTAVRHSQLTGGGHASAPAAPPPAAITYLKQNPDFASQFDQKYGVGASAAALHGGAPSQGGATFPARPGL